MAPLYVTFRLVIWDTESGEERTIRDVKEQEVYFGEIPLMTPNGSFIVNGTERVIVNQLHRSPGVFFDQVRNKDTGSGRSSFSARIVPHDGRWIDFEFDSKDLLHVRIDRKKKFLVSVLLKALGYNDRQIMQYFYPVETIYIGPGEMSKKVNHDVLASQRASADITDPSTGEVVVKKGRRFVRNIVEKLKRANIDIVPIDSSELIDRYAATDIVDKKTGEVIVNFNETITDQKLDLIKSADVSEFDVFYIDNISVVASLRSTVLADKVKTREDSITEIYKKFRPTDPPTLNVAQSFFDNMFFNPDTYRLSQVGRLKINYKLNHGIPDDVSTLTTEDIMETVRYLLGLRGGKGTTDDIDHLGNRRVRTVGELIEDRFYHGLERLARSVKEKMGYQAVENLMPSEASDSENGHRCGEGVLRHGSAFAVHGPDEPAFGNNAQEKAERPRTRRSNEREGGFRG